MVTKEFFDVIMLIVLGTIILGIVSSKNSSTLANAIGSDFNSSLKAMKSS